MLTAPTHHQSSALSLSQKVLLLSLFCNALFITGCASQRRPRFRFNDAAYAHPIMPAEAASVNSTADAPEIDAGASVVLPELSVIRSVPLKPHVAALPVSPPARASKAPDPIITPELTTEELSLAKGDTQRSLDTVDHNISLTQSKRLSSAQSDLLSQIREFANSARDAGRDGDWPRARNLAKKAEVLSQELTGSF
jgi:hypothetical protein